MQRAYPQKSNPHARRKLRLREGKKEDLDYLADQIISRPAIKPAVLD